MVLVTTNLIQGVVLTQQLNEQVAAAAELTERLVVGFQKQDIDPADLKILEKYALMGVIKINPPKKQLQGDLYFPLMTSKVFLNLSINIFTKILMHYIIKHDLRRPNGARVQFSRTTANEYFSRWDTKYAAAATTAGIWEKMVLISRSEAGRNWMADEEKAFEAYIDQTEAEEE
jgi:hypothetical protein